MTIFFYFDEISKILSDPPFEALFEKVSKNDRKKVVGSKNDFSKSCQKFCKLGDEFFYFDEISKMRLLRLKNDILIMYIMAWVELANSVRNFFFLLWDP